MNADETKAFPLAGIEMPAKASLLPSVFIGVYRRLKITLIKTEL
jgi:hypothetical protein